MDYYEEYTKTFPPLVPTNKYLLLVAIHVGSSFYVFIVYLNITVEKQHKGNITKYKAYIFSIIIFIIQ